MHRTTRRWVTGAAALSAGVIMVGPVTAFAQSDTGGSTPPTTAPAPATPGSTATAPKDLSTWITNVLDNLVKAGTITQAQADSVTKALQDAKPMFERGGPGGHWGGRHGVTFGFALDTAAKALGITAEELRTELQTKTVREIATAHGVDVQKVIDALVAEAKTRLDEAVTAGRITQAQADTRLKEMTDRLSTLVDNKLPTPGPGDWGHHGPDRPGTDDDGTTPAPGSTPSTTPSTTAPGGS